MQFTRRNAIVGMGALVAGAGAIGASGAFSSVQADRTVEINTAGDSNAQLQLDINGEQPQNVPGLEDGGSNTIVFDFDKINLNAITQFSGVFDVKPTGGEEQAPWTVDIHTALDQNTSLTEPSLTENNNPQNPEERIVFIPQGLSGNNNTPTEQTSRDNGPSNFNINNNGSVLAGHNDKVTYDIVLNLLGVTSKGDINLSGITDDGIVISAINSESGANQQ